MDVCYREAAIRETRRTLETMRALAATDGIESEDLGLLSVVDMNLSHALEGYRPQHDNVRAVACAIYCLGRFADRMDIAAGDVPGRRCKNVSLRGEYRQYREVAREMTEKLTETLGWA